MHGNHSQHRISFRREEGRITSFTDECTFKEIIIFAYERCFCLLMHYNFLFLGCQFIITHTMSTMISKIFVFARLGTTKFFSREFVKPAISSSKIADSFVLNHIIFSSVNSSCTYLFHTKYSLL